MTDPNAMSDEQFLAAFLDCSLSPAGFDHRGHVRVAWLLLRRYPLDEAVAQTCAGIARLAAHLGVPGKYHRTLSEALVRLMACSGAATPSLSWEHFLEVNDPLLMDARGMLAGYYSHERLSSDEARNRFLPPDLRPLPICHP
jgi:hypothetical protein